MLTKSVISCLLLAAFFNATATHSEPSSTAPRATHDVPKEPADARAILMEMRDFLHNAADLEFDTSFSISGIGQGTSHYRIRQPNLFHVEIESKNKAYTFISDGKALIIYRPKGRRFAQIPARDSIVGTMYAASGILAAQARVLDFFWTVDYASISGGEVRFSATQAATVGNRKCNGFIVERFEDKWEVWLETSGVPLPCKLVSRRRDGSSLTVQSNEFKWITAPKLSSETFEFTPPPNSKRVDISDVK